MCDRVLGVEGAIAVCFEGIGDQVLCVLKGDRCLMWSLVDRVLWVLRVRSLFDVGNRRSGLWVVRGQSLFDVGK